MKENVGNRDRWMRSIVGPAMLAIGYSVLRGRRGRLPGLATMIGGALVAESAVTRVCPLNAALGIDTRERRWPLRLR
jgi:uncharacterized membrane protein